MIPGDTVTFQRRYLHGSQIRRRTARGTVVEIKGHYVLIQVEGAPRYSGLVGIAIDRVKVEHSP